MSIITLCKWQTETAHSLVIASVQQSKLVVTDEGTLNGRDRSPLKYQYTITLTAENVTLLARLVGVENDPHAILQTLRQRFNTSQAFSEFENFLRGSNIPYERKDQTAPLEGN